MKSYGVDGTFPMTDGSIGNIDFVIEADTLVDAITKAQMVVGAIEDLDITLWAIYELEAEG